MVYAYAARAGLYAARYAARVGGRALARRFGRRAGSAVARRAIGSRARGTIKAGLKRGAKVAFGTAAAGAAYKRYKTPTKQSAKAFFNNTQHTLAQSFHKININYRKQKHVKGMKWLTPISCQENNDTFGVASETGRSTASQVKTYMHSAFIRDVWDDLARTYKTTSLWSAVPNINNGYKALRLNIKNIKSTITLVNQGPSTAEIEIMIIMYKNTTSSAKTALTYWQQGLDDIDQNITNRVDTTTAGYSTTYAKIDPDMKPYLSKDFTKMYWTVGKKKLSLETGREHKEVFNFNINRFIDYDHVNDFDKIKGMTCELLIFTKGAIGDTNNDLTIGTITYGPSKVVGVINTKVYAQMINAMPRQWSAPTQFDAAAVNLYTINDENGNVVNLETATNYA